MKTKYTLCIVAAALVLVGCGSTPNKFDNTFFNVVTNYVPRIVTVTNTVPVTNTVEVIRTVTNTVVEAGAPVPVIIQVTNTVERVSYVTNTVQATNVTQETQLAGLSQAGRETVSLAKGTGGLFGVGEIVGVIVAGLLMGYQQFRNRQMAGQLSKTQAVADILAQTVESGRELLKLTPEGQQLDAKFVQWMKDHQKESGVMIQVLDLLDDVVDNETAKITAQKLAALVKERAQ